MIMTLVKKEPDNSKCGHGRHPVRNVKTEAVEQHEDAEEQERVHGSVLKKDVLLDAFDVSHGNLTQDKRAQAVSKQDERNGESEGKCTDDAID